MGVMSLADGKRNMFITQVQPMGSFRGLRTDYSRLSFALALCELYAAVIPWGEPSDEMHDLLVTGLSALEIHPKPPVAFVWTQLQLMRESGFLPQFDVCAVTGSEIKEARPFLTPHGGGYVVEQEVYKYTDRLRTRAEVLYGLARTADLDDPPENLKFAEDALVALYPFWRQIADTPLPANESCVTELRHGLMQTDNGSAERE
jgi:recombinational DNA repair protein (RecF pathway)